MRNINYPEHKMIFEADRFYIVLRKTASKLYMFDFRFKGVSYSNLTSTERVLINIILALRKFYLV